MAEAVSMPKLGMTMEKGTILRWFKDEGDAVEEGEPLLEVMTDKINIEVEATTSGRLLKIIHGPDEEVPVQQVIAYIGAAGEEPPQTEGREADSTVPDQESENTDNPPVSPRLVRATPSARKHAKRLGVSLEAIRGTGRKGRIHRADVEAFASHVQPIESSPEVSVESKPYRGMREIVGRRMVESAFTAPHVTLFTDVDMGACKQMRHELLEVVEQRTGYRLSYTELILRACAAALEQHPEVNASFHGDHIRYHSSIHIGLAVSVAEGLLVPVIRDANRKGLAQLTRECKDLTQAARDNKLKPDQLRGGTFTVSNLGMYAIDGFTPIINQPESAILGVGRIREQAVDVEGEIRLRPMATFSLSFDHRVLDGAPAARFLQTIKHTLENPTTMLV
jgi:pyruvate dehydrogenase E2 component (dihydrolipoamide acetyltransferase)